MSKTVPLREIALHICCRSGSCCATSDHKGARLTGVTLVPSGSGCDLARRAVELCEVPGLHRSPGINAWLVERLAEVAPLVCGVGGEMVDVPVLVNRLLKGSVWS